MSYIQYTCITYMIFFSNYADLCHLLPKMQRENWFGVMGGIATQIESALTAGGSSPTCPFTPGALHISGQTFHLPQVPSFLLTLAHVSTRIMRGSRGRGGQRIWTPPTKKIIKLKLGFLSNTGTDSLENHKATK